MCPMTLYRPSYPLDQFEFCIVEYGYDVHRLIAVCRSEADRELNARQDRLQVFGTISLST